LNFLDTTITRTNKNLKFNIYRKPTYTDIIIPYNSCHPTQHKIAALRYFTNRLNTYPIEQTERINEKTIIQNIAHNNSFPIHIINELLKKPPTQKRPEQKTRKWATLTYYGKESYQISKIFKDTNVQITYKTRNTLQYLQNQKPKHTNLYERSGVYQLTCSVCNETYTGQTGRNFEKRFKEHLQAYKYNPQNSKFAQHATESGHTFGKKTDILTIKVIGKKSKFLDTMEKYIYQETKINNQINDKNTVSYNKIFETILENQTTKNSTYI
jgi:hypothetical protein